MYQIVGMFFIHLSAPDDAGRVAPGIDLKAMTFLGIDVGLKDQSATRHIHVLIDHTFQVCLQLVGIIKVALYIDDIINSTHVNIGEYATDLLVGMHNDALIARLGLAGHTVLCNRIDNSHDNSRYDNQHHHDSEA